LVLKTEIILQGKLEIAVWGEGRRSKSQVLHSHTESRARRINQSEACNFPGCIHHIYSSGCCKMYVEILIHILSLWDELMMYNLHNSTSDEKTINGLFMLEQTCLTFLGCGDAGCLYQGCIHKPMMQHLTKEQLISLNCVLTQFSCPSVSRRDSI
jgi:hypothetical protein